MKVYGALVAAIALALAIALVMAPAPRSARAEALCFRETGFCLGNASFEDYFRQRGGEQTFGYPISRPLTLRGFEVQIFQRLVMQLQSDGQVNVLNLLEEEWMPVTHVHGLSLPSADRQLVNNAPRVGEPAYDAQIIEFNRREVRDEWQGRSSRFSATFDALPEPGAAMRAAAGQRSLVPLVHVEVWGVVTSAPASDPYNPKLLYQRYQRSVMQYDADCDCTTWLPVGEWFKQVITGEQLPGDLRADMRQSLSGWLFLDQYDRPSENGPVRAVDLPNASMLRAFAPDLQQDVVFTPTPTSTPTATATLTATSTAKPTTDAPPTSTSTATLTGPTRTSTAKPTGPTSTSTTMPATTTTPTDSGRPTTSTTPTASSTPTDTGRPTTSTTPTASSMPTNTGTPTATGTPTPNVTVAPTSTPSSGLQPRNGSDSPPDLATVLAYVLLAGLIGTPGVAMVVTKWRT